MKVSAPEMLVIIPQFSGKVCALKGRSEARWGDMKLWSVPNRATAVSELQVYTVTLLQLRWEGWHIHISHRWLVCDKPGQQELSPTYSCHHTQSYCNGPYIQYITRSKTASSQTAFMNLGACHFSNNLTVPTCSSPRRLTSASDFTYLIIIFSLFFSCPHSPSCLSCSHQVKGWSSIVYVCEFACVCVVVGGRV